MFFFKKKICQFMQVYVSIFVEKFDGNFHVKIADFL